MAWLAYEVGKTWPEDDADTAKAIGFLEVHAREMLRLVSKSSLARFPGEDNELIYLPLGMVW